MPALWPLLVVLALAGDAGSEPAGQLLGTALRQDGYTVRPPRRFRMASRELFHGTRAGAVAMGPAETHWLSAALKNGEGDDASSMLIAVVESPFHATPAARDEFSTAVVRHYAEELSLRFSMERAELVPGPAARIEVLGSVRQEGQVRHVLVAAMAGEARHAVVTFSAPSGQWEALAGQFRTSLDSFRNEVPAPSEVTRSVAAAVATVFAGGLLASLYFWRKRRQARAQP